MSRIEDKVAELINTRIPDRTARILELTPGEGNLTRKLMELGYTQIEAMDIHPENFKMEGVKCHHGNLSQPFPFKDEGFDLVISVEGIEHLENQYQFASEINRVLKTQGHAVITTPNIVNFASRLRFLFTGFYALATRPSSEFEKNWVVEHIYPITFWQLRHILHTSGLFIQDLATDKIRNSAKLGVLFYPFTLFFSWLALRKEADTRQRRVNMEILRQMHLPPLFFGRTQIAIAQKQSSTYRKVD